MARIEAETLLPSEGLREMVVAGEVTQIHRGQEYAAVGDSFAIENEEFEVTEVTERRLGELTDEDARAEGSPNIEAYRERLRRAHEEFEWDGSADVVRHRFEPLNGE
jgi:hypothetical protein